MDQAVLILNGLRFNYSLILIHDGMDAYYVPSGWRVQLPSAEFVKWVSTFLVYSRQLVQQSLAINGDL